MWHFVLRCFLRQRVLSLCFVVFLRNSVHDIGHFGVKIELDVGYMPCVMCFPPEAKLLRLLYKQNAFTEYMATLGYIWFLPLCLPVASVFYLALS